MYGQIPYNFVQVYGHFRTVVRTASVQISYNVRLIPYSRTEERFSRQTVCTAFNVVRTARVSKARFPRHNFRGTVCTDLTFWFSYLCGAYFETVIVNLQIILFKNNKKRALSIRFSPSGVFPGSLTKTWHCVYLFLIATLFLSSVNVSASMTETQLF